MSFNQNSNFKIRVQDHPNLVNIALSNSKVEIENKNPNFIQDKENKISKTEPKLPFAMLGSNKTLKNDEKDDKMSNDSLRKSFISEEREFNKSIENLKKNNKLNEDMINQDYDIFMSLKSNPGLNNYSDDYKHDSNENLKKTHQSNGFNNYSKKRLPLTEINLTSEFLPKKDIGYQNESYESYSN